MYQAFNFRTIKNLFMVSARFNDSYFILQVLLTCIPLISHVLIFDTSPASELHQGLLPGSGADCQNPPHRGDQEEDHAHHNSWVRNIFLFSFERDKTSCGA